MGTQVKYTTLLVVSVIVICAFHWHATINAAACLALFYKQCQYLGIEVEETKLAFSETLITLRN